MAAMSVLNIIAGGLKGRFQVYVNGSKYTISLLSV